MGQLQNCINYAIGVSIAMEYIETSGFSKIRENYFDVSQFNMLQLYLMDRPDAGDIIEGTGGVRVICYSITKDGQILFLIANVKSGASELSRDAINAIHELVRSL